MSDDIFVVQPDVAFPIQPPELHNCPIRKASLSLMHSLVHDEIEFFCKKVQSWIGHHYHYIIPSLPSLFLFSFLSQILQSECLSNICSFDRLQCVVTFYWMFDMMGSRLLQRIWLGSPTSIGLSNELHGLSRCFGPDPGQIYLVQLQMACPFQQVMWTLWFVCLLLGTW